MELGLLASSIYMRNQHETEGPNVKNVLGFALMRQDQWLRTFLKQNNWRAKGKNKGKRRLQVL